MKKILSACITLLSYLFEQVCVHHKGNISNNKAHVRR